MTTATDIDNIIDAIITRIRTNITSLGGTVETPILEGDEMPAQIRIFPSIYVIPFLNGDRITTKMSGSPRYHEFSLTLAGVYKSTTVSSMLRTVRGYGLTAADLFSLDNQKVSGTSKSAVCLDPVVRVGYHQLGSSGFVLTWAVEMTIKTVTD